MPRPKKVRAMPIETFTIEINGEEIIHEVWDNPADEGTRGAHMLRKRYDVFSTVLAFCEESLNGNSSISKDNIKRLIYGQEPLAAFGKTVITFAKTKGIKISKTLSEEVAQMVRTHYKAIDAALAEKAANKKIPP